MPVISKQKGPRLLGAALFMLLIGTVRAYPQDHRLLHVFLEGDRIVSRETAIDITRLRPGDPVDTESIQRAAERLRHAASDRYYPMARVRWRTEPVRQGHAVNVFYHFDLGPKGRLKELRFVGREAMPELRLRKALVARPRRAPWYRWFGWDVFRLEDLEADNMALLKAYHQQGYAAVDIGPPVIEKPPGLGGFRVTWPIVYEGPVFTLGYIGLNTDVALSRETLNDVLELRSGERFDSERIRNARERLEDYLLRQGHAFARVHVESARLDEQARIDLVFLVHAGARPRLRHIDVVGNTTTHTRIIEREIEVQPGEVFDLDVLQLAQYRLDLLPLFSEVAILYELADRDQAYDVRVEVHERKTGRIEAGFTYGEQERGVGQLTVRELNLSLAPPFRGSALQGHATAYFGTRFFRLDLGLQNPRIGTSHWSLDGSAAYEDNQYVSAHYSQRMTGGQLLTGHPLGRRQLFHTGYAGTGYELYDVDEAVMDVTAMDSDFLLTAWVLSWDMDHTDRLLRPNRGIRLRGGVRLGSRVLGGDTETIQTHAEAALFYNPISEHVISLRGGVRGVAAYGGTDSVPHPLRLFLGGGHTLRGFGYRTVAPRDEETERLTGGRSSWWSTLEYLFPLSRRFDLALYVDAGDVSSEAYRFAGDGPVSNWGVGLLVRADNFPVRFDFAFPIHTYENDLINQRNQLRLSFSAGYRYH